MSKKRENGIDEFSMPSFFVQSFMSDWKLPTRDSLPKLWKKKHFPFSIEESIARNFSNACIFQSFGGDDTYNGSPPKSNQIATDEIQAGAAFAIRLGEKEKGEKIRKRQ